MSQQPHFGILRTFMNDLENGAISNINREMLFELNAEFRELQRALENLNIVEGTETNT